MADFTVSTIKDNYQSAVVAFNYSGNAGAVPAFGLSGGILASSLTGWDNSYGITSSSVDLGVTRVFWSLPVGASAQSVELSWGISGSLTGTPFLYLNGGGNVNFMADGMKFTNSYTGTDRLNSIRVRNTAPMSPTDTASVVVEIDKNYGFRK